MSDEVATRVREPRGPRWSTLALAAACGMLAALCSVAVLGGFDASTTITRNVTVTAPAPAAGPGATVITKTLVPELVGQALDVARERTEARRFDLVIRSGGGVFGVIRDDNWEVVAQDPGPGTLFEQGSTVRVDIVKR